MNAKLKKIGNIVIDVLVILVLVISLTITVLSLTSKANGVPTLFGYTLLSVQTDSMEPNIKVGDLIVGKVYDSNTMTLTEGDVITFKQARDNTYFFNTHRIMNIEGEGDSRIYTTKGDNAPDVDSKRITNKDIVSLYTEKRVPGMGKVIDFFKSTVGFICCLWIPVVLFLLFYAIKFFRNLSEYNKEKTEELIKEKTAAYDNEQKEKIIAEYLAAQQAKVDKPTEDENAGKDENPDQQK